MAKADIDALLERVQALAQLHGKTDTPLTQKERVARIRAMKDENDSPAVLRRKTAYRKDRIKRNKRVRESRRLNRA